MKLNKDFTITAETEGQIEPSGTVRTTYTEYITFTISIDKDNTAELRMPKDTFKVLQKKKSGVFS